MILTTPAVKEADGYIPDLSSRYFTADFSYGLTLIKQIADLCGLSVPHISQTLQWYDQIALSNASFSYAAYGINSREALVRFYQR